MRTLSKENVIFYFSPKNKAVYSVEDGETFWVETDDCYSGQISSVQIKRGDIDISIMDCSVGPISVTNATVGDTLCVEIVDIVLANKGVMVTSPKLGVLGHKITEADTKIIPISDGFAHFSPTIQLPLTPMVGVLGVSPKEDAIHCAIPGDHGSNMDTTKLKIGAKVYLPIQIDGAGLACGDIHACMGDGELSGTGLEIAGKICLKTTVMKQLFLSRPMVDVDGGIYTIASHCDIHKAIEIATDDMVLFLMREKKLEFPDAYRLLSATCDVQISQVVNEMFTIRVHAPKLNLQINGISNNR